MGDARKREVRTLEKPLSGQHDFVFVAARLALRAGGDESLAVWVVTGICLSAFLIASKLTRQSNITFSVGIFSQVAGPKVWLPAGKFFSMYSSTLRR